MSEAQPFNRGRPTSTLNLERDDFERSVSAWRASPTAGHLGDVLSYMVDPSFAEEVAEISRQALLKPDSLSQLQRSLLSVASDDEVVEMSKQNVEACNPYVQARVRESRLLLRMFPKNPLLLLDFAQLKLSSGDFRAADRLVQTARALSPDDRVILRTQARLWAHAGMSDRAHKLIASHRRTRLDPWLMATEIALAQLSEVSPVFAKTGLRVAKDKSIQPRHLSELAGALAGIELNAGSVKRARDLFRIALLQPNDNVVAQAITDQKFLAIAVDVDGRWMGDRSEAKSLMAWNSLDTEAAYHSALDWHAEEPFSSRPLQFLGSLLAAVGRYEVAATLSMRGLISDSKDAGLMANLAYALAAQGNVEKAEKFARKSVASGSNTYLYQSIATLGLIDMKRGLIEAADAKYKTALDGFLESGQPVSHAICYAYYARSAYDCGHPASVQLTAEALMAYKKHPSTDGAFVLKKLGQDVASESQSKVPLLRTYQWEFDSQKNEIVKMSRIVSPEEPLIKFLR